MRDLDAIELTESITGEAILPRDVDHEGGEPMPPLPKPGAVEWDDFARLANELGRVAPSLLFSERSRVAVGLLDSEWRRRHDADVRLAELDALDAEYDETCCGFYNPDGCDTCAARKTVRDRAAQLRGEGS